MVGAVGSDSYGDEYLQQLQHEGVDCQFIKRSDKFGTGTASIQVGGSGENTIIIVRGANFDVTLTDDVAIGDIVALSNVVVCQNEIPITTTKAVLSLCNHHKTLCILNPAPVSAELIELVPLCDIICPNEVELAALTALPASSDEEIGVAVLKLLELGCRGVVVTLGSKGACYATKGSGVQFVTAEVVSAIDSVGAGDSFIGEKEGCRGGGSCHLSFTRHCYYYYRHAGLQSVSLHPLVGVHRASGPLCIPVSHQDGCAVIVSAAQRHRGVGIRSSSADRWTRRREVACLHQRHHVVRVELPPTRQHEYT